MPPTFTAPEGLTNTANVFQCSVSDGTNTTVDEESKGIKVEGTESSPAKGYIVINGGRHLKRHTPQ